MTNEWQPIETAPEKQPVLVSYKNYYNIPKIIIARFVSNNSEHCEHYEECCCEYNEEQDKYFAPEGWYEQLDNWGDYSEVQVCEGRPTHWMSLPEKPKGK